MQGYGTPLAITSSYTGIPKLALFASCSVEMKPLYPACLTGVVNTGSCGNYSPSNLSRRAGTGTCFKVNEEVFLGEMSLTGAQIENLASLVSDYVNGTDEPITAEVIKDVIKQFQEAVDQIRNYKDDKTLIDTKRAVGFELSSTF